jgi:hypothetical protein
MNRVARAPRRVPSSATMSAVLTMPPPLRYRCPTCRAIDWFRDGCVISEADIGRELGCGRVQRKDPTLAGTAWSCNQCAHEVPLGSALEHDLDDLQLQTCDQR